MKIAALALHGSATWPGAGADQLVAGLNVFHGPPASGKTAVADLVTHALCGRRLTPVAAAHDVAQAPEGELIVENGPQRFRLRRVHDGTSAGRLTVAALDGAPVDRDTVRELVYGLSPTLLGPMYTVNFREPLRPESLLAGSFAEEFRATFCATAEAGGDADEIRRRIRALEWELTTLITALGYRRTRRRAIAPNNTKADRVAPTASQNRASDFLCKLTGGEWTGLQKIRRHPGVMAVHRTGRVSSLRALSATERDQVYLSVCLSLVSACAERGVQLPLVLDEPFVRLDRREAARLVAVLDEFGRRGHQVLVFTARQEAVERFAERGATTHDLLANRSRANDSAFGVVTEAKTQSEGVDPSARPATQAPRKRRRRAG